MTEVTSESSTQSVEEQTKKIDEETHGEDIDIPNFNESVLQNSTENIDLTSSGEMEEEKKTRRKTVRWADEPLDVELDSLSSSSIELNTLANSLSSPSKLAEIYFVDYLESKAHRLFRKYRTTIFLGISIAIALIVAITLIIYLIAVY